MNETIKIQDQYMRELHDEKRNLMKKMQECEELKMNIKFYEQRSDSLQFKLDERDALISRLKSKQSQLESDKNRLECENIQLKNRIKK